MCWFITATSKEPFSDQIPTFCLLGLVRRHLKIKKKITDDAKQKRRTNQFAVPEIISRVSA